MLIGRGHGKTDKMVESLIPVLRTNQKIVIVGTQTSANGICQRLREKGFPCLLEVQRPLVAMDGKESKENIFSISLMQLGRVALVQSSLPLDYGSLILNRHSQQLSFISKAIDKRAIEGGESFNYDAWQHVTPYLVYTVPGDELKEGDLLAYPEKEVRVEHWVPSESHYYQKIIMDLRVNHSHVHSIIPGPDTAEKKIIQAYVDKRPLSIK